MPEKCIKFQYTLETFVENNGAIRAAELLGISHSAVHQMLGYKRIVFVKKIGSDWHYSEVKQWKRGKSKKAKSKKRLKP